MLLGIFLLNYLPSFSTSVTLNARSDAVGIKGRQEMIKWRELRVLSFSRGLLGT